MKTHPLHIFSHCPKCGSARFTDNDERSRRCEDCGFVYYLNASGSTVALIENSRGEWLVTRRAKSPAKGTLDLPGGFTDIGETVEETKQEGFLIVLLNIMNIAILLSANLGVMNLLPIPALDGGRLLFLLIELVRGKALDKEKEGLVHTIGFILLLGIMALVFFNDILKLIRG